MGFRASAKVSTFLWDLIRSQLLIREGKRDHYYQLGEEKLMKLNTLIA